MKPFPQTCLLVLLAIPFVATLNPAGAQELVRTQDGFRMTRSLSVPPVARMLVEGLSGRVEVRSESRANRIGVEEEVTFRVRTEDEARRLAARLPVLVEVRGDRAVVTGQAQREISRSVHVMVPPGTEMEVQLASGSIVLDGLEAAANLRTSAGSVEVRGVSGNVQVSSSGGSLLAEDISGSFRATTSGGSITARGVVGEVAVVTAGGSVEVTRAGAGVQVSTAGGGVTVRGAGGDVDVSTAGGSIVLEDVSGAAELSTAGGNLSLSGVGGMVEASTSGGDIRARGLKAGGDLETLAGDIDAHDVRGNLRLRTQVGDISVRLSPGETVPQVVAVTQLGDIELDLARSVSTRLDTYIGHSGGYSGHDIISDFPVTRQSGGSGRIRSVGSLGAGTGSVRLEAQDGSIRIRAVDN